MSSSPDAAIFALFQSPGAPGPQAAPEDATELVLRLTAAAHEVTALLRAASAQLRQGRQEWRAEELVHLGNLLAEAERAARDQAHCTAALLRQMTRRGLG